MRRGQGRIVVHRRDPVALVHDARGGDRDAYLALFDRYAPAVLAALGELAPDTEDPEAMLREVFEAVLLADLPEFSDEFSVADWLVELAYVAGA